MIGHQALLSALQPRISQYASGCTTGKVACQQRVHIANLGKLWLNVACAGSSLPTVCLHERIAPLLAAWGPCAYQTEQLPKGTGKLWACVWTHCEPEKRHPPSLPLWGSTRSRERPPPGHHRCCAGEGPPSHAHAHGAPPPCAATGPAAACPGTRRSGLPQLPSWASHHLHVVSHVHVSLTVISKKMAS